MRESTATQEAAVGRCSLSSGAQAREGSRAGSTQHYRHVQRMSRKGEFREMESRYKREGVFREILLEKSSE